MAAAAAHLADGVGRAGVGGAVVAGQLVSVDVHTLVHGGRALVDEHGRVLSDLRGGRAVRSSAQNECLLLPGACRQRRAKRRGGGAVLPALVLTSSVMLQVTGWVEPWSQNSPAGQASISEGVGQ